MINVSETAASKITELSQTSHASRRGRGDRRRHEFLTGQLARLVIESDNPFTPGQKTAQLKLISEMFALRNFHLVVDRGAVVSLAFADRPTRH